MKKFGLDIETKPLPNDMVLKFEPSEYKLGNTKDPDKVRAAIAEKRAAFIDSATLDAKTCFICAIGYYDGVNTTLDIIDSLAEEEALLRRFWRWYLENTGRGGSGGPLIVGHYLRKFDMPMIIRRSWKYQISMPLDMVLTFGRLQNNFIDTAELWGLGVHGEYVSLKHLLRYFGLGDKEEDFLFWEQYNLNKEKAIAYLENDVKSVYKVSDYLMQF